MHIGMAKNMLIECSLSLGSGVIDMYGKEYIFVHQDHTLLKFWRKETASRNCDPLLSELKGTDREPVLDREWYRISRDLMKRLSYLASARQTTA